MDCFDVFWVSNLLVFFFFGFFRTSLLSLVGGISRGSVSGCGCWCWWQVTGCRNLGRLWELNYLYQGLSKHQEAGFTPVTKVKKNYCGFLGPSWFNKKVDPEIYVSFGPYELLVSNVAHQLNEKWMVQNKCAHFL